MSGFDTSPDPALAIINDIMKQLQENSASMRMLWEVNHNRLSKLFKEELSCVDEEGLDEPVCPNGAHGSVWEINPWMKDFERPLTYWLAESRGMEKRTVAWITIIAMTMADVELAGVVISPPVLCTLRTITMSGCVTKLSLESIATDLGCIKNELGSMANGQGSIDDILKRAGKSINDFRLTSKWCLEAWNCVLLPDFLDIIEEHYLLGIEGLDGPVCPNGVHGSVLGEIDRWVKGLEQPPILWLTGLPGGEKNTIIRNIVTSMNGAGAEPAGVYTSSFFCNLSKWWKPWQLQATLHSVFPTLSAGLAKSCPPFRERLFKVYKKDPYMFNSDGLTLNQQVEKLIFKPLRGLQQSGVQRVIFIINDCWSDSNREFTDNEPLHHILDILKQHEPEIKDLGIKFFITSGAISPVKYIADVVHRFDPEFITALTLSKEEVDIELATGSS